ncbi:MAG: hypothetical protein K6C12_00515 [Oscillospiraceae bacterium]|nr:hypothetical protein [Oscillospiraceae bacterium]
MIKSWGRFLLIWALILLLLGAAGCFVLYRYLGIYEVTRPDAVIAEYLSNTDAEELIRLAGDHVRLDVTEFEDAEALYSAYLDTVDLSRPLSFRAMTSQSSETQLVYLVRAGAYNLCTVVLEPDGDSPGFGRYYWKISEVRSAAITDILPSAQITVEALAGQPLALNGHPLTEDYITERDIEIPDLTPLELRMSPKPSLVRYRIGPLFGEISLTDENGTLLSPSEDSGDTELYYSTVTGNHSLKIHAPEDIELTVNGLVLGKEDISSSNYGVLEGLDAYTLDGAYQTCVYAFDGLHFQPSVSAKTSDGTELEAVKVNDSYWFFYPNDPELEEYVRLPVENFFNAYIQYTTRSFDATLFYNLISKVLPGTELHSYISITRETMAWAGSSSDDSSVSYDNFHQVSGTCFVCTARYSVDRTSKYWFDEVSTTQEGIYELAFVSTSGMWYAAGMNIISAS